MNKKFIIIVGSIFMILIAGIILLSLDNKTIQDVDGAQAKQILNKYPNDSLFIDVRTNDEHQENGIEGSIVIPYDQIDSIVKHYPDKDTHIIVYCNTGRRSGIAAKTLRTLGYQNIYDMGSYQNW